MSKRTKTIQTKALFRDLELRADAPGEDEEDTREVSFLLSTETPVERFFGDEILDHDKKSVDLEFLNSGRAPILLNHDFDRQIGVIESATLKDRELHVTGRIGNSELAREVLQDIRDGVRRNSSIGYRVNRMVLEESGDREVFRITDWRPFEGSVVPVGADVNATVSGRDQQETFETIVEYEETRQMTEENTIVETRVEEVKLSDAERESIRNDKIKKEENRVADILALATRWNMRKDAESYIKDGKSIEEFRGFVLENIGDDKPLYQPEAELGLTKKEVRGFSLCNLFRAQLDTNKRNVEAAAFELECSAEVEKRLGKAPQGSFLPHEMRVASVGTATAGGNLVGTDHLGSSFIEVLRNKTVVRRAGARSLDGLQGNVQIPRRTAGATATWNSAENTPAGESDSTFDLVTLSPNDLSVYGDMTRRLLQQSDPSIEALVRSDLAIAIAQGTDVAALNGAGAGGVPEGILQTAGIGSHDFTTTYDWDGVVQVWSEVAQDNAEEGSLNWIFRVEDVAQSLTTEKATNTAQFIMMNRTDGLLGYPVMTTQNMPANTILFGNFNDFIIGTWGALDVLADPYSNSLTGALRLVVYMTMDFAVRHPESFAQGVNTA